MRLKLKRQNRLIKYLILNNNVLYMLYCYMASLCTHSVCRVSCYLLRYTVSGGNKKNEAGFVRLMAVCSCSDKLFKIIYCLLNPVLFGDHIYIKIICIVGLYGELYEHRNLLLFLIFHKQTTILEPTK